MSWEIIAAIIAREGINVAFKLWRNVLDKEPVTEEKWNDLLKSRKTAAEILEEVRQTGAEGGQV